MHKLARTIGVALTVSIIFGANLLAPLEAREKSKAINKANDEKVAQSKKNNQKAETPKSGKPKTSPQIVTHPLDPMTFEELEQNVSIFKREGLLKQGVSLVSLTSDEPSKDAVLSWKQGDPITRKSIAVLYDIEKNETREVITNLTEGKIASNIFRKGVQPMQLEEDTPLGIELLKADAAWMKGLERRGIPNMENVHMEMFVVGNPVNITNSDGDRLIRAYPYYRVVGDNSFGEPIEGLSALVNLTKKTVAVRDNKEIIPLAGSGSNYLDEKNIGPLRTPCKPMVVTQPNGPSFTMDGHQIKWQKWRFRYELDSREGLVLHNIGYEDQGKVRSILHRAGVSEVSVPYGAPGLDWVWRSPIDEGEYGLGRLTTTLRQGHEVPENAVTLQEPYADSVGNVKMKPGALAIWEQDGGILWEHHDDDAMRTSTRRSRQLVIGHMFTLGNYDYFTNYIFNQDGSIEVKVTLNGDVLAQGVINKDCDVCAQEPDEEGRILPKGIERYGTLLAPHIVGINHQHFFCFRLDFDIDGVKNNLYELNVKPLSESRGYLQQNTFSLEKTLLRREEEAARELNYESNRCWKIVNKNAPRYLGHSPGYVLQPAANAYSFSHQNSYNRKRAGFLSHHFWSTQFKPDEMYAAGDYPVSSIGNQGLTEWVNDDSIDNEDLVVWYTVGITHTPRVEDWPVMPSASMGFKLQPEGFFTRNPALDIPEAQTPLTHQPVRKPAQSKRTEAGMR